MASVGTELDWLKDDIAELRSEIAQLNRTVTGLQNDLIRAGKYQNDDPIKRLDGIQVLLKRAGEYVGRRQKGRETKKV